MATTTKTTGKTSGSTRRLSSEEYRVLAEHAEQQQKQNAKKDRAAKAKRAVGVPDRKWATDKHVATGNKQERAAHSSTKSQRAAQRPTGDERWRRQRDGQIRQRNRARRRPWQAAAAATGIGLAGQGVVTLLSATTSADPHIVAACCTVAPVATAAGIAVSGEKRYQQRLSHAGQHPDPETPPAPAHRRLLPEYLLATAAAGGLVYWIATTGPSWLVALAVLVTTSLIGTRWWQAHPLGPRVPYLNPPQASEPAPEVPAAAPQEDPDSYPKRWSRNNAAGDGCVAKGSRLTNERRDEYITAYDVELKPGTHTIDKLRAHHAQLASGLQLNADKLLILDDEQGRGAHMAQIKIIEQDPTPGIRYYTGPQVTCTADDGIVHSIGRYGDGDGDLDMIMWDSAGMVPTAIIGPTRSGKSAIGNVSILGSLDTGVMNLCYIDPKGMSSPDMAHLARVAILGPENASRAPELVDAIAEARRRYGMHHRVEKLNPTAELPGWTVLHDEFSELVNKGYQKEGKKWTSLANTIAAMGMWPVAMNQAMHESKWIDDQCRSAFGSQFTVMRMNTGSDKLFPGLELKPSDLPSRKGVGTYVNNRGSDLRSNIPIQFDYLPEAKEAHKHPDAPLSTTQVFEQHDHQPEIPDIDRQAIEAILGPPNSDGRWIVAPGGDHAFPSKDAKEGTRSSSRRSSSRSGFGAQLAQAAAGADEDGEDVDETTSDRVKREILQFIAGGTHKTGEIKEACSADRNAVERALTDLTTDGHIVRTGKGVYDLPEAAVTTV